MIRLAAFAQVLSSISLMFSCTVAQAAELNFNQQEFQLPLGTENLVVADLNGDGFLELLSLIHISEPTRPY